MTPPAALYFGLARRRLAQHTLRLGSFADQPCVRLALAQAAMIESDGLRPARLATQQTERRSPSCGAAQAATQLV